mgnify:CR=1 FL=1
MMTCQSSKLFFPLFFFFQPHNCSTMKLKRKFSLGIFFLVISECELMWWHFCKVAYIHIEKIENFKHGQNQTEFKRLCKISINVFDTQPSCHIFTIPPTCSVCQSFLLNVLSYKQSSIYPSVWPFVHLTTGLQQSMSIHHIWTFLLIFKRKSTVINTFWCILQLKQFFLMNI